jgi:hypothetical protein
MDWFFWFTDSMPKDIFAIAKFRSQEWAWMPNSWTKGLNADFLNAELDWMPSICCFAFLDLKVYLHILVISFGNRRFWRGTLRYWVPKHTTETVFVNVKGALKRSKNVNIRCFYQLKYDMYLLPLTVYMCFICPYWTYIIVPRNKYLIIGSGCFHKSF